MKRSNLIFTHGAVFSVGIAAAMIANSMRAPEPTTAGDQGGRSNRAQSGPASGPFSDKTDGDSKNAKGDKAIAAKRAGTPKERLAGIVRITDAFERQRALMDLIDTLGPDEFAGMMDQFRELDHLGDSWGEYSLLVRGWAKADPLTALEYMETQPNSGFGRNTILSTWAGNDAAAAERWALDHYDGTGANPYMASVIRGVAANDIATASRLAESMPLSRERGEAVDGITRALFLQGVDAAMAYPATIKDEALRAGFVGAIAQRLVGKDVDKAAAWLASMPQGDAQNRGARTIADALAKKDTTKAAAWVKTLQPEAQAEAASGVIPVMSASDIAGTAQWVSGLAGTPNYDRVVEDFVWSCNTRAPEQSAAWIQGVSNADQQRRLYHRMLGEWGQKDANAMKQWVAANNVPEDIRRRFLR